MKTPPLASKLTAYSISLLSFIASFLFILWTTSMVVSALDPIPPSSEQADGLYGLYLRQMLGISDLRSYGGDPTVRDSLTLNGVGLTGLQKKIGADCGDGKYIISINDDGSLICDGKLPGVCGTANGQYVTTLPTSGLCAPGSTASIPTGTGPWSWNCSRDTTTACKAYIRVGTCPDGFSESWRTGSQGGNCKAMMPSGWQVMDNQLPVTSPYINLINTTSGYSGSVRWNCVDDSPIPGTIIPRWKYVSGSCDSIYSCAPPPTCVAAGRCQITVNNPSSTNQAWSAGGAQCGYVCTGGYTGPGCATPPAEPPYCSLTLPACFAAGNCAESANTPSTPNQPWTASGAQCGYTCTGGWSGPNCDIVPTPSAPIALSGAAGNAQVSLSWVTPASGTVTDYQIEYRVTSTTPWTIFPDGVSTGTTTVVTGLTNGTSYDFQVKAVNAGGPSGPSNIVTLTPVASNVCRIQQILGAGTSTYNPGDPVYNTFASDYSDPYKVWTAGAANQAVRMVYGGSSGGYGKFTATGVYTTARPANVGGCTFTPPPPEPSSCQLPVPICSTTGGCSLNYAPTSPNQAWVRNSTSCGFQCINGYMGNQCELAPAPGACGTFSCNVSILTNGNMGIGCWNNFKAKLDIWQNNGYITSSQKSRIINDGNVSWNNSCGKASQAAATMSPFFAQSILTSLPVTGIFTLDTEERGVFGGCSVDAQVACPAPAGVCGPASISGSILYPTGMAACTSGAQTPVDTVGADGSYDWKCGTTSCSGNVLNPRCEVPWFITRNGFIEDSGLEELGIGAFVDLGTGLITGAIHSFSCTAYDGARCTIGASSLGPLYRKITCNPL